MALRAMPCKTSGCHRVTIAGRSVAVLRTGEPYIVGRAPSFPCRIYCASCKRPSTITAAEFNALPALTVADLAEHRMLEPYLKDLKGAGHAPHEAADLFAAGWNPVTLDELPKQETGDAV